VIAVINRNLSEGNFIFPAAVNFSTDLHSLGQYIQEGRGHIFATVLNVEKTPEEIPLPAGEIDMGFNYLAGKPLSFVNKKRWRGPLLPM